MSGEVNTIQTLRKFGGGSLETFSGEAQLIADNGVDFT